MSKGIQFKNSSGEKIYPSPYMPIGSVIKSTSSSNPSNVYGGTWSQVSSGYERQCVGSQVIYDGISGSGNVSKTNLLGAYDYTLISGMFSNVTIPTGSHKEYRLTFQATTGGDNKITMYLNNIASSSEGTWSGNHFRIIGYTKFFKETEITKETTMGYSGQGMNLKYQVTGSSSTWQIFNVTIHAFIVPDVQIYTWRRTA